MVFPCTLTRHLQVYQNAKANTQVIESLAPRIKSLADLLGGEVCEDDITEKERRDRLEG